MVWVLGISPGQFVMLFNYTILPISLNPLVALLRRPRCSVGETSNIRSKYNVTRIAAIEMGGFAVIPGISISCWMPCDSQVSTP
ncbi:hypothetical protein BD779DRAFT_1542050 [Infundibulicybe gibba]|nr:hypothetical protein BD779DRAFT_1542050 [Infundibulicybe gibba]